MSDVISVQISGVLTRIISCFLSRSKAFEKVLSKTLSKGNHSKKRESSLDKSSLLPQRLF